MYLNQFLRLQFLMPSLGHFLVVGSRNMNRPLIGNLQFNARIGDFPWHMGSEVVLGKCVTLRLENT